MGNRKQKPERIVPFNLRLPATLHARIVAVAASEDRSAAAEMRRALERHVESHEQSDSNPDPIAA